MEGEDSQILQVSNALRGGIIGRSPKLSSGAVAGFIELL